MYEPILVHTLKHLALPCAVVILNPVHKTGKFYSTQTSRKYASWNWFSLSTQCCCTGPAGVPWTSLSRYVVFNNWGSIAKWNCFLPQFLCKSPTPQPPVPQHLVSWYSTRSRHAGVLSPTMNWTNRLVKDSMRHAPTLRYMVTQIPVWVQINLASDSCPMWTVPLPLRMFVVKLEMECFSFT